MTNLVDHVFAIRTPCQVLSAVVLFVPVQMPDNVAVRDTLTERCCHKPVNRKEFTLAVPAQPDPKISPSGEGRGYAAAATPTRDPDRADYGSVHRSDASVVADLVVAFVANY
ncbi:hypothetical protein QNA24_22360 [Rhodococcus qingshengii]|nr:hypothetical protein [Rhodococcus qingshengii]